MNLPRLFVFCAVLVTPTLAFASPWVLQPGETALFGRFDFGSADEEFLDSGPAVPFNLNGELRTLGFELGARFGIFKDFEIQLDIPLKLVSYTADPVILIPTEDPDSFDYYQENVLDFSQSKMGVGDIKIAGRWQVFRSQAVGALELRVKTPTGYDPPAGTFGRNPRDAEEFLANVGSFVQPENIQDDVSLGDGQLDVGAAFLFGWALPTRTFIRADIGGDLRIDAGNRFVGGLKLGQFLGDRLLLVAGVGAEIALQDGEVIGVSVAAEDPNLPATEYGGLTNLVLREVRLDKDIVAVSGGAIVRLSESTEITFDYSRIIHGRNVAEVQTLSIGFGVRVDPPMD